MGLLSMHERPERVTRNSICTSILTSFHSFLSFISIRLLHVFLFSIFIFMYVNLFLLFELYFCYFHFCSYKIAHMSSWMCDDVLSLNDYYCGNRLPFVRRSSVSKNVFMLLLLLFHIQLRIEVNKKTVGE